MWNAGGRVGVLCMSPLRHRDTEYILTELPSPSLMHIYSYMSMQDMNSNLSASSPSCHINVASIQIHLILTHIFKNSAYYHLSKFVASKSPESDVPENSTYSEFNELWYKVL